LHVDSISFFSSSKTFVFYFSNQTKLVWHPPAPSGKINQIQLPNDAKPNTELSLTVNGEDEKYPFHVGAGAYGGRMVNCLMPEPSLDNQVSMGRLGPECSVSDPPIMKCT
jgi:hypothetical protein